MYCTEGGTQPQEEEAREGRAKEDEGGKSRGGGTETETVIGFTKVTAGCKTPEVNAKASFWVPKGVRIALKC